MDEINFRNKLATQEMIRLQETHNNEYIFSKFNYILEKSCSNNEFGWVTPDPLPLPPPQHSFVASQENLLEAVESWVAEY
ncbi:MAG: hypothetical protein ACKPH7_11480 [Planktothrix sp.]|uniref:hypothetical protein n=1 Tax=Planktothrix sp. TaxID=3088171 RepID=UPI0038D4ABF0